MESILAQSVISAFLTILIIASGIVLRKNGEPYKKGIFMLHKLSVVASIVFVILIYVEHFKLLQFQGFGFFLFMLSCLILIAAFLTGAVLSFDRISSYRIKIIHRLTSWLTVLFIPVIWLYCH